MRRVERPLRPDDTLDRAMELFNDNDLLALPVVDKDRRVLGVVRRYDAANAYLRRLHEPRTPSSPSLDIGTPSEDLKGP
jgi:CBS domain-containing protein